MASIRACRLLPLPEMRTVIFWEGGCGMLFERVFAWGVYVYMVGFRCFTSRMDA